MAYQMLRQFKVVTFSRQHVFAKRKLSIVLNRFALNCSNFLHFPLQLFDTEAKKSCASEVNPLPALHHSLGNIINDLVFGITYKRDDPDWLYLQRLQEEGVKLIGVSGVVNFLPWLRHLPANVRNIRFLLEGKAKTHAIYDRIVEACGQRLKEKQKVFKELQEQKRLQRQLEKEQLRQSKEADPSQEQSEADEDDEESDEEDTYEPECILEHFLAVRDTDSQLYCDDQLRHLLADLFGAGVDTSLATLRWFLLYLAREQRCQRRLHELLLPLGPSPTLEELEPLAYLRACISETMRIRSVVPLGIPHGCKENFVVGDYFIKGGSMIVCSEWAIHMDPVAFPEPEEFRPERFLTADGAYQAPPQFIPFSSGYRMCPGEEMARMILTLFTGRILRRFHLELPSGTEVDMAGESGITLTPTPHMLRFTKLPAVEMRHAPDGAVVQD